MSVPRPVPCPPRLEELMRVAVVEEALSGMRHDLRNRIATLRNSVYYLERKLGQQTELLASDPRIGQFLGLLSKELETLGGAVAAAKREPALLGAKISAAAVANELAEWAARHGGRVEVEGGAALELPYAELAVPMWCLLENALEAAGGGAVTIGLSDAGDGVRVEVTDAGPGFTAEARERALKHGFTTRPNRLGAGLKVAHRFAARYCGKVEVLPAEHGARVCFVLRAPQEGQQ